MIILFFSGICLSHSSLDGHKLDDPSELRCMYMVHLTAVLPSKADNVPNSDVEDSHPTPSHPTSTQTAGTPSCEVSFQLKKQKLPSPVV